MEPKDTHDIKYNATFSDYPIDRVAKVFHPIIISIGIIGNIFALLLLHRKWIRDSSVAFFLSILACTDMLFLISFFTFRWLTNSIIPLDLADLNSVACKFAFYTNSLFLALSSWIIVAVSMDRFVAVFFPFKAHYCSKFRAKIVSVCIIFTISSLYLYMFWAWHSHKGECTMKIDYHVVTTQILIYIHLGLYPVLPGVIVFVLNTLIIIKTYQQSKNRQVITNSRTSSTSVSKKMTFMVVMTTVTYLVLTLPMAIMYAMTFSSSSSEDSWGVQNETEYTLRNISDFCHLVNSSVNFLLYSLSGSKFRKEAKNMVKSWFKCCQSRVYPVQQ